MTLIMSICSRKSLNLKRIFVKLQKKDRLHIMRTECMYSSINLNIFFRLQSYRDFAEEYAISLLDNFSDLIFNFNIYLLDSITEHICPVVAKVSIFKVLKCLVRLSFTFDMIDISSLFLFTAKVTSIFTLVHIIDGFDGFGFC